MTVQTWRLALNYARAVAFWSNGPASPWRLRPSGRSWNRTWTASPATLKELGDIRIDDVLSFIDRGIEKMPSYMDLYRRWESQQWAVAPRLLARPPGLAGRQRDGSQSDALVASPVLQRRGARHVDAGALRLGGAVTEVEIFLSTQMVDEARHTVFFERWWREVVGTDAKDLTSVEGDQADANEGYNELFYDRLPSTSQRLASNPTDIEAFIEGITLYHIVIERRSP